VSLDHILLGTLREPASGYDLKARFDAVFRHFWPAELSQIYRTLRRLELDGLLSSRAAASEKGPERRVYRTTAKGRAALRRWLADGPTVRDDRHAFCAQTFFLDELGDLDRQAAFLRGIREEFAARHAELVETERGWRAADPRYPDDLPADELFQQFTLTLGLEKYAAIVRWADVCLQRLEHRRQHLDAVAEVNSSNSDPQPGEAP
jgi:PadR family transcriptional regulator, regulatory protein AphA